MSKSLPYALGIAGQPAAGPFALGGMTAANPFEALLPEDRLAQLKSMPADRKREFYGRVVDSVFSDPAYQNLVSSVARREFDLMTSKGGSGSETDLRAVVQDVVERVLRERGR